jgi:hypothetical protein
MVPSQAQGVEEIVTTHLEHAVGCVLASAAFQRSHRLSQLLRYLAEHTASGDVEGVKEAAIGQRVFGRPPNYNSAEDNIVRANIRQLRLKLEEYYAGPGAADPWIVSLPKGSYSLAVERRHGPVAPETTLPAGTTQRRAWSKPAAIGVACGAAAFLILTFAFPRPAAVEPPRAGSPRCLLGLLAANPGQRLSVVVPDADVQMYQRLTGRTVALQDYLARKFTRAEALQDVSPALAASADALFRHVNTQSFVLDLIPRFAQVIPPSQLSVRHPSTLAVSDFEKDNALLISGPYGDPWVQLFDPNLNFQVAIDADKRAYIANRAPRASEQKTYYNYTDASHTVFCYARIAYLPGLSASNRVLLAGGPHTASTDAACRFLTRPDSLMAVYRLFHVNSPAQLPWFELLVEARALGNSPWSMRILAHRVVAAQTALAH